MPNLTQGDTGYGFKLTLEDENGAVDLTDTTVLFLMGAHTITAQPEDALNGVVLVTFEEVHTATYGDYLALAQVTYADGSVEHYPSEGYINVRIKEGVK